VAKDKKFFNYEFKEGIIEIPSDFVAICTKTGTEVHIYHKNLIPLIESKFKNSFELFKSTYVCPAYAKEFNENINSDPYRINIYGIYLIACYNSAIKINDTFTLTQCAERFENHFNNFISKRL
jgi:hypothetical protein